MIPRAPRPDETSEEIEEDVDIKEEETSKPLIDTTALEPYLRPIAGGLQRAGEVAFGLPGDIINLGKGIQSQIQSELPESLTRKDEDKFFFEKYTDDLMGSFLEAVPSSEDLRKISKEKRPELEPQSEAEEFAQDVVEDFTSLAMGPGSIMKKLGLAVLGNLGSQTLKAFGYPEMYQSAAKVGTFIFGGMFGKGRGMKTYLNGLYDKRKAAIPRGQSYRYNPRKINNLKSELKKGSITAEKQAALKIIEEMENKIVNGTMAVEDMAEFDRNISQAMRRANSDESFKHLSSLQDVHQEQLSEYGRFNPAFKEYNDMAKEGYAGMKASYRVQARMRKWLNAKSLPYVAALFLSDQAIPGSIKTKMGIAGAAATSLYAKDLFKRVVKNPTLRQYYVNMLQASLKENRGQFLRNAELFNKEAEKSMKEKTIPRARRPK